MKQVINIKQKILKLLRVNIQAIGLEITPKALHCARLKGQQWEFQTITIPPDTIRDGKIENREQFAEALKKLHAALVPENPNHLISAIVSIGTNHIYSQAFHLPFLEGAQLDEAVALNMQMIAPGNQDQVYASSEVINTDSDKGITQILGSFVGREQADELGSDLLRAGFLTVAIEFKALSLARFIRSEVRNYDKKKPTIVYVIDDGGVTVAILRNGNLYFDYFTAWRDIVAERKALTPAIFQEELVRITQQILNFYNQHVGAIPPAVLVIAGSLEDRLKKFLSSSLSIPAESCVLDISIPVPGTLYPALGAGIRGLSFFANNNEINLVGADVEKEFRGVQYEHLFSLWRVAVPVIALVCLCALISTDIYLVKKSTTIAQEVANKMPSGDIQELNELEASARTFNEAVSRVRAIQTATSPVAPILQKVLGIVKNNGVAIQTVSYDANSQKIAFVGTTNTEAQVVAFKQALSKEESFENIEFSLANIRTTTQGVSFSVDFTVKK